ncbi:hypothetical protein TNCV_4464911 [Trichonephila clavipes]|nr:hypothetical protein TNCV_4464911 [Trichonephila clavipes]
MLNTTNERRPVQGDETPLGVKGDIEDVPSELDNGVRYMEVPLYIKDAQRTVPVRHGRSYRRINDTGPPIYRGPKLCNSSPTNSAFISKKGPQKNFDTGPLRTSCVSAVRSVV